MGDIHQPLHASALFNERFPHGDQGGNFFLIQYQEGIGNLHKLLDSGYGLLNNNITRPLNEESLAYIRNLGKEYMNEFPKTHYHHSYFSHYSNFSDWVEESNDIARKMVYPGMEYNSTPTEEYVHEGFQMARERIALGGYRLAELMKIFYSSFKNFTENDKTPSYQNREHNRKFLNTFDE
jgi:hypothetical protein